MSDQDPAANRQNRLVGQEALFTPRFYRTDHAAMDRLDFEPVRADWYALMAEFAVDRNQGYFRQDNTFKSEGLKRLNDVALRTRVARERGGLIETVRRAGLVISGAVVFARLFLIPAKRNELPLEPRPAPAW